MTGCVEVEQRNGVRILCIANPPVNALDCDTLASLDAAVAGIEEAPDVLAVVITGAGSRAFAAGGDISEFELFLAEPSRLFERSLWTRRIFERIEALPMPVIAAVQAPAVGGGTEVALLCDLVVADSRAFFGLPEVKLGIIPGAGGTQRLPRRVGIARAKELIFLGETITADEALRIGIVNRIAADGNALGEALALADSIAQRPAMAVQHAKAAMTQGIGLPSDVGLDVENAHLLATVRTEDARECCRAFMEKRAPRLQHR